VGGPIGTLPGFPDSSTCLTFRGFLCLLVAIHAFEFGLEFLGHEKDLRLVESSLRLGEHEKIIKEGFFGFETSMRPEDFCSPTDG
jgi:hypothetical protein